MVWTALGFVVPLASETDPACASNFPRVPQPTPTGVTPASPMTVGRVLGASVKT